MEFLSQKDADRRYAIRGLLIIGAIILSAIALIWFLFFRPSPQPLPLKEIAPPARQAPPANTPPQKTPPATPRSPFSSTFNYHFDEVQTTVISDFSADLFWLPA